MVFGLGLGFCCWFWGGWFVFCGFFFSLSKYIPPWFSIHQFHLLSSSRFAHRKRIALNYFCISRNFCQIGRPQFSLIPFNSLDIKSDKISGLVDRGRTVDVSYLNLSTAEQSLTIFWETNQDIIV